MESETGHYETLGVAPDASTDEIRKRYLYLARSAHPDMHGSLSTGQDSAGSRMRAINAAWETLGNPKRRSAYDRELRVRTASTGGEAADGRRSDPNGAGEHRFAAADPFETDRFNGDDFDEDDFDDDAEAETTETSPGPGWLVMSAPGTLVFGWVVVVLGALTDVEGFMVIGVVTLCLSAALFLAASLMALAASRRADRHRQPLDTRRRQDRRSFDS